MYSLIYNFLFNKYCVFHTWTDLSDDWFKKIHHNRSAQKGDKNKTKIFAQSKIFRNHRFLLVGFFCPKFHVSLHVVHDLSKLTVESPKGDQPVKD